MPEAAKPTMSRVATFRIEAGARVGEDCFGSLTVDFTLTTEQRKRIVALERVSVLTARAFPAEILIEMLERAAKEVSRG